MSDYKKLYFDLFDAVTKTIEALQAAQVEAEIQYMLLKTSEKKKSKKRKATNILNLHKKRPGKPKR